jgi:hypothetical protein
MSNQGTVRLKVINGSPEVNKLWNGRYSLSFLCENNSAKEDWYYDNISSILPEYGILQDADFGSGVSEDWEAIPGSVYPDMRLVETEYVYIPSIGDKRVKLTYETLTDQFVKEKDNNLDYDLNGLQRVTTFGVALPNAPYSKNIGGDTLTDGGISCRLASVKIEKTEAKWTTEKVWIEPGVLSETEDRVGSQKSIVIEWIGEEIYNTPGINPVPPPGEPPFTPEGYVVANARINNFQGLTTTQYTFLKPGILSSSISEQNSGNSTTGKIRTEVIESFNQVPETTIDGILIGKQVSNFEGIPTNRYTFVKADGNIRTSTRPAPSALAGCTFFTVESVGTEITPPGILTEESEVNDNGFIRWTKTVLTGAPIGIKETYKDVVEVEVPGTVDCTTIVVNSGSETGSLAIPKVVPRRRKKVSATVTVEIATSTLSTDQLAYDLGKISCSVITTNSSLQISPNVTLTYENNLGGNKSVTGQNKSFNAGGQIQVYPGSYLTSSSSNGIVTYEATKVPVLTGTGNSHTFITTTSSRETKCIGSGSTSADGYLEYGIIRRDSRPILTTINGTTYYEIITWSV